MAIFRLWAYHLGFHSFIRVDLFSLSGTRSYKLISSPICSAGIMDRSLISIAEVILFSNSSQLIRLDWGWKCFWMNQLSEALIANNGKCWKIKEKWGKLGRFWKKITLEKWKVCFGGVRTFE